MLMQYKSKSSGTESRNGCSCGGGGASGERGREYNGKDLLRQEITGETRKDNNSNTFEEDDKKKDAECRK